MQKNVFAGVLTSQEGGTLSKFECKDTKNIWNMQIWEGEKLRNFDKNEKKRDILSRIKNKVKID